MVALKSAITSVSGGLWPNCINKRSKKALSPVNWRLCALFFRYLRREGIVTDDPMRNIPTPKREKKLPSFLYYNETERCCDPDAQSPTGLRDRRCGKLLRRRPADQ